MKAIGQSNCRSTKEHASVRHFTPGWEAPVKRGMMIFLGLTFWPSLPGRRVQSLLRHRGYLHSQKILGFSSLYYHLFRWWFTRNY
jgi:hypothetical protein